MAATSWMDSIFFFPTGVFPFLRGMFGHEKTPERWASGVAVLVGFSCGASCFGHGWAQGGVSETSLQRAALCHAFFETSCRQHYVCRAFVGYEWADLDMGTRLAPS